MHEGKNIAGPPKKIQIFFIVMDIKICYIDMKQKGGSIMYSIYIVAAAVLWGIISLFSTELKNSGLSPGSIVALRSFGAAAVLSAIFFIKDKSIFKIKLGDIKYFIGTGIISFVWFNWCLFTSMNECTTAIAVVLLYTAPVFVVFLSALFFNERITGVKIIALVMTLIGCALVTGVAQGNINGTLFGVICGIGSGLFYGLYSIFGRFALNKYSHITVTVYTFIFAAIGSVPLCHIHEMASALSSPRGCIPAVLIVLVSTVAPFLLYTKGLSEVESGTASILATIEPAVGVFISVSILHQRLTLPSLMGIILIFSAVAALNVRNRRV